MDTVIMQSGNEGVNYSNIGMVLATPMALLIVMLVTATDPDQAIPAPSTALTQPVFAVAASVAPAGDDLFVELRNRGHTDASAATLAARFTSAVPDPMRRRELALLASQLSTSLRWSDDEAATRVIAAASKGQDAVDAMNPPARR